MSKRVLRKQRDPLEYIEKLLERTTLSTQRVTHEHIMDLGDQALTRARSAGKSEKEFLIGNVVTAAEKRHSLELSAALERQSEELEDEHKDQILRIKYYYEKLAKKVADQRDKAEGERIRLLTKQLQDEKEKALEEQKQQMEKEKEEAIREALAAQLKRLRNEFALEKEKAIADALAKAREKFKIREAEAIARTKAECKRLAAEEAARVAAIHAREMKLLNDKYIALQKLFQEEQEQRIQLEKDFMELQNDYKNFMINTGGKYNADYLMIMRDYGWEIKSSQPSTSLLFKKKRCHVNSQSASLEHSINRLCVTSRTG